MINFNTARSARATETSRATTTSSRATSAEGARAPLTWEGDRQSIATEDLEENALGDDIEWRFATYVGGMPSGPSQATRHVPHNLWDTADVNFIDQVMCHAGIKVWKIDHKVGRFTVRMKCHWRFRLYKSDSRTEPRVRIPGIRMPDLSVTVDESRVWRDLEKDTRSTMYFSGSSVFSFEGFQLLNVRDFPFDRQLLDLGLLEFVWRKEKDTDIYEESMRICHLTLDTTSLLPQWRPHSAMLRPLNESVFDGGKPLHATRFRVKIRVSRRPQFYIIQVFCLTFMILVTTLLPLGLKANLVGNRLALLAGGMLTLTAFKFSIAEQLPSVPYATVLDNYLIMQVVTICVVMGWVVLEYKFTPVHHQERWRVVSDVLMLLIVFVWTSVVAYFGVFRTREDWDATWTGDMKNAEEYQDMTGQVQ